MAQLFGEFEGGEMYFDNPRRRRRRKGGAKRRHVTHHRRHAMAANPVGRRHRRRAGKRRHTRHHFSRNPVGGSTPRSLMGRVTEGVKGGAGVVLGKIVVRSVPGFLKMDRASLLGIGLQAATGVILTPFVDKMLKGMGKPFLYGAFAAPIESAIVKFNIPIAAPALSSYQDGLLALPVQSRITGGQPFAAYAGNEEERVIVQ